jgi:hypothetical protein
MIQTILNYIHTLWEYITNTITGLIGMVSAFVSANQVLTNVMAYAPPCSFRRCWFNYNCFYN